MSNAKRALYITEDGPQTIAPVTSHAGDEISGPPQRQAALDAHELVRQDPQAIPLDIEHQPVTNDPRLWSDRRKVTSLVPSLGISLIHIFGFSTRLLLLLHSLAWHQLWGLICTTVRE
jgi:hypothetical protein